jgi:hypothetical protein
MGNKKKRKTIIAHFLNTHAPEGEFKTRAKGDDFNPPFSSFEKVTFVYTILGLSKIVKTDSSHWCLFILLK